MAKFKHKESGKVFETDFEPLFSKLKSEGWEEVKEKTKDDKEKEDK